MSILRHGKDRQHTHTHTHTHTHAHKHNHSTQKRHAHPLTHTNGSLLEELVIAQLGFIRGISLRRTIADDVHLHGKECVKNMGISKTREKSTWKSMTHSTLELFLHLLLSVFPENWFE